MGLASGLLLLSGCMVPPPRPFRSPEGPIKLTVVNHIDLGVNVVLFGTPEPVPLGFFVGRETQMFEIPWEGRGEIRVRLSRFGGGELSETFPIQAEPGDRFLLELGSDLRQARIERN